MPAEWVSPDANTSDRVCIVYYQTSAALNALPPGKEISYKPGDPMPSFLVEKGVTQGEWDEILAGIPKFTNMAKKESRFAFCLTCCCNSTCCEICCLCCCLLVLTRDRVKFEVEWSEKLNPKDLELTAEDKNLTTACSMDECCTPAPEVYYFMIQPRTAEDEDEESDAVEGGPPEATTVGKSQAPDQQQMEYGTVAYGTVS